MAATGGSFLPSVTCYDINEKNLDRQLRRAALTAVLNLREQLCVNDLRIHEDLAKTNRHDRHETVIYYTTNVNNDATHETV